MDVQLSIPTLKNSRRWKFVCFHKKIPFGKLTLLAGTSLFFNIGSTSFKGSICYCYVGLQELYYLVDVQQPSDETPSEAPFDIVPFGADER